MQKLLLIFTITICFLSCDSNTIKGDKNIVTKEFEVSDYSKIHLTTLGNVIYTQNENLPSRLYIEIDSNLVDFIDIKNEDGYLCIFNKEGVNFRASKFNIYANSKTIKDIKLSGVGKFKAPEKVNANKIDMTMKGVGDINFYNLEADSAIVYLEGTGRISIKGYATYAAIEAKGVGSIDASEFIADKAECRLQGVGKIDVHVTDSLTTWNSGIGKIRNQSTAHFTDFK